MRKRLVVCLLFSCSAWADSYTLNTSGGIWSTPSIWNKTGGGVSSVAPGDGDSVIIPDGMFVWVQGPIVVGPSGAGGTPAVTLNNSGELKLYSGTFTARGDVVYTPAACNNTSTAVFMNAGTSFIFDSSAASAPATTHYAFGPAGPSGCRPFQSAGTASQRNTVTSNPAGGAGVFSERGFGAWNTQSGSFIATYTDFSNIGDATYPGWQVGYDNANNNIQWNVTHSTFTNCGKINGSNGIGSLLGPGSAAVFQHSYNIHSQTASNEIFDGWFGQAPLTTGTRMVRNNVFDVPFSLSGFQSYGFTFWSNYFGEASGITGGAGGWVAFQGNLYRESLNSVLGYTILLAGNAVNNYFVYEEPQASNPHGPNATKLPSNMIGNITDHTGYLTGSMSAWWITNNSLTGSNYSFINNLILPNAAGHSSFWITLTIPMTPGTTFTIEHNTVNVDNVTGMGGLGIQSNHGLTAAANGMLASYRSNLLWNPGASNMAYKLWAADQGSAHNLDVCTPAACDYNDGWNMLTDGGGFPNGGNGYADNFSSSPGRHDLAVNPMFAADPASISVRNLATFDGAYLHNTATPWSSGASYSVGNMVSSMDPTLYNGATINYRYTNGSFGGAKCSSANPKPGLYTAAARACWEWATLFDIRQARTAEALQNSSYCPQGSTWNTKSGVGQCLYDDQTIGAHGVEIIRTLAAWVTAGYAPTNSLLAGTAHDGSDIGAVPVSFLAPSGLKPVNGGTPVRGGRVGKGVVR